MNADNPAVPGAPGPYASPTPTAANPQANGVPPAGQSAGATAGPGQQRTGHHQVRPASAAPASAAPASTPPASAPQPESTAHSPSPSPYSEPARAQWSPGASSTQHATAPTNEAQQVTGEAPTRSSLLRTGTQTTGLHRSVPAEAEGERTGAAGMLKGLGRLLKRKEAADPTTTTGAARKAGGPRRVRAMLTTVDPWSVMKLAFLLSIAAGIMFVVATAIVWSVLNNMGVFISINDQITTMFGAESETNMLQFFDRNKIMSVAILLSVVNALIMTGLATIGAMLYNLVVKLVGGVYVTLTDE